MAVAKRQGRETPSKVEQSVTRVYAPRFFVSSQQKFGDIKAPWWVTALGGQTVL